jgi:hypothetical protein
MKVLEVTLKMVVKVPQNTDLKDVMVDIHGDPNIVVYTNGGLRKVRHTVPSWALSEPKGSEL